MNDVALRLAGPDDVPALAALVGASVRGLGEGFYTSDEIEAGLRDVFGVDTQLVEDRTYFVIEHHGQAVGATRRRLARGERTRNIAQRDVELCAGNVRRLTSVSTLRVVSACSCAGVARRMPQCPATARNSRNCAISCS